MASVEEISSSSLSLIENGHSGLSFSRGDDIHLPLNLRFYFEWLGHLNNELKKYYFNSIYCNKYILNEHQ